MPRDGSPNKSMVDDRLARQGAVSYLEIPATNVQKSALFYQQIFGWNISDLDSDRPSFTDQSGQLLGRWTTVRGVSGDAGFRPYIYVDQITNTVARVAACGGEVIKLPYAQGDLWLCTIRDPAGNLIGLWQDGNR